MLVDFDLDAEERSLFAQFRNSAYTTGILRNTGIIPKAPIINIGTNSQYHLPILPGMYGINPTAVSGLWIALYGSASSVVDEKQVQGDNIAAVERLPSSVRGQTVKAPSFVTYRNHTPFALTVTPEAIEGGFYERLNGLQGRRGIWFTGAAFQTHDSSLLWEFTESVLKNLTAS